MPMPEGAQGIHVWPTARLWAVGFLVAVLVTTGTTQSSVLAATCSSINDCLAQQEKLRQQLLAHQRQAQQAAQQAAQAGQQVQQLGQSLDQTQHAIDDLQGQIDDLSQSISDKEAKIKQTEADLATQKQNQDAAISTLYQVGDTDPLSVVLSSSNISDVLQQSQYLSSVEDNVQAVIERTNKTKAELEQQKHDLDDQKTKVDQLKAEQESQKVTLAVQQQSAAADQADASAQQRAAESSAKNDQAQIAALQQKMSVLTSTARWGSDIVSDSPAGWSYVQLNYYQSLGNSPYTIHDYGCLVTSLAMVATYYGNTVSPPQIASHTNWFSYGNAYVSSIADGIGLVQTHGGAVNWDVIDNELASGHPVIISIYLPQVGAINADGSSHFIVISGKSGNHYIMQDPLGSGRGYNIGQVRSYLTFRTQ